MNQADTRTVRPQTTASVAATGLAALRAVDIVELVVRGELSAEDVTLAHLRCIDESNPSVHALIRVDGERALRSARRVDRARLAGRVLGPLAGIPIVVKDNLDVAGQPTSCASRAREPAAARRHATVVSHVLAADAVLIGRANMDEMALGASTQTSVFGPTRNPWDLRRSPGGSSGGCAAAVAAGMSALAIGSDTGGSIREPAAQCGVVGMAPSPDLVPTDGLVRFAPAYERVGPFARNCADLDRLLTTLADHGEPAPPGRPVGRLRVGVIEDVCGHHNRAAVRARFEVMLAGLADAGVDVIAVRIPAALEALDAYFTLTSAACVRTLAAAVATGRSGAEVLRRYEIGRSLTSAAIAQARITEAKLITQTRLALTRCDALISPTMPTTAPLLDGGVASTPSMEQLADPMAAPYTDCWTVLANLTGLASLSVPAGLSAEDGMPVGIMISAAAGADRDLLTLGSTLEDVLRDADGLLD